jgi:CRP/FNR family transcriptional regulator
MVPNTPPTYTLGNVPIFAGLDAGTLGVLEAESRVRRFPKGQVLCSEGDPGEELLLLETGRVTVSRFSQGGHETVLAELDAPTAFGELALFDAAPRSATVTAATGVQIRYLARRVVLDLVEREPRVAIAMMQGLGAMVRATNERLGDVLSLDVPGRLAKWLLAHDGGEGRVPLDQSQESLALSLGTTRETLNRALRRFERRGIVAVEGHEIGLLDIAALQSIASG